MQVAGNRYFSNQDVSNPLFRIYVFSLLCRFAGYCVLYKCCRDICVAVYQVLRITLLDTTPSLKQLKSFCRFRAFYFTSIFNCIVQVGMLGAMGDIRRWMDLYFVVGYYFAFVLTMKRKCAAEGDCVNATIPSRAFLHPVNCHDSDDKMYSLHVNSDLNHVYRDVGF